MYEAARTFASLRERGWRPFPETLTAGYVGNLAVVGLLHQVFPTLVVGNARTGKTVLLRYFAAQAALHQVRLILWDVAGG